jgi:cell division protein ZapE
MSPIQRYQADLHRPGFRRDAAQQVAVDLFQALYEKLVSPPPVPSVWKRLLGQRAMPEKGLYLWGDPGRGKTHLMDCFYECVPFAEKRRVHFHRFMLEIHRLLDTLPKTPDPLLVVADRLAAQSRLLCLDEFNVTDIADAMLLAGLLEALFARQLILVATSNIAPESLYENGLQRDRFLPAIQLLEEHTLVHRLAGKQDFRFELLQHNGTYRLARGEAARHWLEKALLELAPLEPKRRVKLEVHGRELCAHAWVEDIVWFHFDELCLRPRSAQDYLELACEFHTLLLEGVPRMGEDLDEAARRFIHLIDALYDHRVKLVTTADAVPERLYQGTQLQKLFRRTASRLTEMSCEDYLSRPHRSG